MPVLTRAPQAQRILVATEPDGFFPEGFVNQFGVLVSPFPVAGFRGTWIKSHGALPLLFGVRFERAHIKSVMDSAALAALAPVPKADAISVVVSRKTSMRGHRQRLQLIRHLAAPLGDRLKVYGRGFQGIVDKADAISPFSYHLVLENTVMDSYWTEKLADAYVGYSFPFVTGPPDLSRWFSPESFLRIDVGKPEEAVIKILAAMDSGIAEKRKAAVAESRRSVLERERLFHVASRIIADCKVRRERLPQAATVLPPPRPPAARRGLAKLQSQYWKLDQRIRSLLDR